MKTKYLVVDTTAFIQNAPLHDIGENVVTVQDVINEIRNKRQLRHLASLTYNLEVKDVFSESISFVTEFSKKTGDFPCLSVTDMRVLALTYQLQKQLMGTDYIKTCPTIKRTVDYVNRPVLTSASTPGFYLPAKDVVTELLYNQPEEDVELIENSVMQQHDLSDTIDKNNISQIGESTNGQNISILSDLIDKCTINVEDVIDKVRQVDYIDGNETNGNYTDDSDDNNSVTNSFEEEADYENDVSYVYSDESDNSNENLSAESDNDSSGWITPKNITAIKRTLNPGQFENIPVMVGCITTDYAMQNVLKQMGLNVIALDGRVIKEMRTFILRCYACFKTTTNMRKQFCPTCGNKTLKRVAVSIDENGNQRIHVNLKKPLTARGKRFPLPLPKGGKHAVNPRLVEDAPRPHQRPSKLAKIKTNALHPDYTAGTSPFAMRDIYSKSAQLGFVHGKPVFKYWMRKNPNEPKKTNRKKK